MYKFWNQHMIPRCFHLMGNPKDQYGDFSSCSSSSSSFQKEETQALAAAAVAVKKRKTKTKKKKKKKKKSKRIIKVIKSDGIVTIYRRHIHVSELMLEFPKHMVCRSDSFYIGQKIPAMSEKEKLQMGHKYFLLPMHCFQSVLSLVNIASTFSSSNAIKNANRPPNANANAPSFIINKAAAALPPNCQAFDIQKTASGYLNLRVSDDFISQLIHMEEEEEEEEDEDEESRSSRRRLCSSDELEKEYTQLVGCRRGNWKPKLETIRENHTSKTKKNKSKKKKKCHHPKLSSFFIIKKIRKKRNKNKLSSTSTSTSTSTSNSTSTSTSTSNSAHKTTSSSDSCPFPPPPPPPPPKSKKMKFMRSNSKK